MADVLLPLAAVIGALLLAGVAWRLFEFSRYLRFVRMVRAGLLDEAAPLFPALLRTSPRLVEGGPMLTQASLDVRLLGLPLPEERVRSFFDEVARMGREKRPQSPVFLRLEANLLRQRGRLEEGRALVEEAVRLDPDDAVNRQQKGWFDELSGDLEGAAREYRAALDLLSRARPGATSRRRLPALRASLWRSLSQTQARQGRLEEAADALREAIQLDGCSPEGLFTRVALAGLQERMGRAEQAGESLREALKDCEEGQALLHQTLAGLFTRAGRYDEAEEELRRAEHLEPGSVAYPLARAEIEAGRGRPDRALEELDRAVAAEPHNPAVQMALARHHERQGDDLRAMVHLERAVESPPGEGPFGALRDAVLQTPRERLADCYARLGRLDDAEREYRRALKEGPGGPTLRASLGTLLVLRGRVEEGEALIREARAALEEALQRSPGDPRVLQALGSLLLRAGEAGPAREHLERALQLGAGDFFAWRDLGEAQHLAGHPEEARRCWEKARDLARRPDLARQVEESLERLGGQAGDTGQRPTDSSEE